MNKMSWRSSWRSHHSYRSKPRRSSSRIIYRLGLLSFLGVVLFLILTVVLLPVFAYNLPSPEKLVRREGFSTKIYDRSGVLLYDIYSNQRRTPIKFEEIPPYLRQATIAIEDKNFYSHSGFDSSGILRAVWNIIIHQRLQGGSTLTQQLAKNVLLSSERTLPRKIKEFILALQIERKYKKDEILTMYLNEAPYGGTAWGVEAASDVYFGKPARDLTLVEAAILAGLPQRPSAYSPYGSDQQAYKARTKQVLRRMQEDSYITKEQEDAAIKELTQIKFIGKGASFKAPHFVMYVKGLLEDKYGATLVEQGGLKVTTTLDWNLQEAAQAAVSEEIAKVEDLHITNGAAVVLDPNSGEILAMVGSKDFNAQDYDGQVNVTLSPRQPGSSIKPVTYLTGLHKGYTASTLLIDAPTVFPGGVNQPDYKPVSYDGKYRGPVQIRNALANSLNIPAVKMLALVGVENMLKVAGDLGIKTLEPTKENLDRFGLSVTLGGGEVRLLDITGAYSVFANGGKRVDPVAILKVEDSSGKTLEEYQHLEPKQIIDAAEAFIISDILSDNNARADVFGRAAYLSIPNYTVAVKTGTTNDQRDNWTIGWNPLALVGVWVGNNDNSPMKKVASGVTGAAPIWNRIMRGVLAGKPNISFEIPSNVVNVQVDSLSGHRSHDGYPERSEYFIKGTEPTSEDPVHTRLKVCKGGSDLATPSQIAAGDFDEKEFYVLKEEDPTGPPSGSGRENRWQQGIIDWLSGQSDARFHFPTGYCGGANPLNVEFIKPKDREQVNSSSLDVKIDPRSTSDIVQLEVELDGIKQATLTSAPWQINLTGIKDGPHELRAKARDKEGHESDRKIKIGVNSAWDGATNQ